MTDGTQPVHAAPPTAEDPGHFRDLFEQHLHPMFVEDWSRLKQFLDNLQAVGVTDFVAYFADQPQDFARIPHLIVWQHVNRAGCGMFGVASVPELVHYMRTDPKQNFQSSGTCFQALMNGQVAVQIESEDFNLNGDRLTLAETFGLADGFEKTWARIYIGVNDITDLRTTEAAFRNQKNVQQLLLDETRRLVVAGKECRLEFATLAGLREDLAGTLDGARIIRIAGDKIREIFQTEVLEILLHDEDAGMIRAPYSYYEGFKDKDPFPFGEGLASQIILSGQPSLMGSSEDHSNEGALILSASDETMSERRSWPLTGRLA